MENTNDTAAETVKKRGGSRKGAGRPVGSGAEVEHENVVIRTPVPMRQEANAKLPIMKEMGLDITKLILIGMRKELDKIPYPEGVQPIERYVPKYAKPKAKRDVPGRPPGAKNKKKK